MQLVNLADIGQLVHARRTALGLSQARLATMSGLSRATINQLETGTLVDLGVAKLIKLLDLVGINLDAGTRKGHHGALQLASQSASYQLQDTAQSRRHGRGHGGRRLAKRDHAARFDPAGRSDHVFDSGCCRRGGI